METKYLYLGLMLFSISYPLAQSFEWRIQLYKKWRRLFPALLIMCLFFIPWDIWFTVEGIWWFNYDYTTGLKIVNLPFEEWLFFLVVPYCCVFIFEVLNYYVKKDIFKKIANPIYLLMAVLLAIGAFSYQDRLYPLVTFSLTALALLAFIWYNPSWKGRFLLAYIVIWIPFLLINGALTGLFTEAAVVNYNPEEHIGFRVLTIPIEDSVYNLLMLLMVMVVYMWPLDRAVKKEQ